MKGFLDSIRMSGSLLSKRMKALISSYFHAQYVLFSPVGYFLDAEGHEWALRRINRRKNTKSAGGLNAKHLDSTHSGWLPNMMEK